MAQVQLATRIDARVKKAVERLLPEEIEELKLWLRQFLNDKPELQESLIYLRA